MKALITNIKSFESYKFNQLYTSVEDCISDLMLIDITKHAFKQFAKGQDYIISFQKQIRSGQELSKKQITMLKRIAREIIYYLANIQNKNY